MEADWEIEIGPGAPVIDVDWEGFVDLRKSPRRMAEIAEAVQSQALADALLRLNGDASSWWTSKCDLWTLAEFDPDEMDATPEEAQAAIACYIDLLPRGAQVFSSIEFAQELARSIVTRLKPCANPCCRIDLIVRSAALSHRIGYGITAYISACGSTSDAAENSLGAALNALVDASC